MAALEKVCVCYHIVEKEKEIEEKGNYYFGDASKRADDKFFEFIVSAFPKIPYKIVDRFGDTTILMKKTRFQMLEYAIQRWTQEMTDESFAAFRFLIEAFNLQKKEEILDRILRPRVEKFFTKVELIEKWIMACTRVPVPHEIQQLLVMARAQNGGPELAKRDITNSRQ